MTKTIIEQAVENYMVNVGFPKSYIDEEKKRGYQLYSPKGLGIATETARLIFERIEKEDTLRRDSLGSNISRTMLSGRVYRELKKECGI